jgi:hypothetical protein
VRSACEQIAGHMRALVANLDRPDPAVPPGLVAELVQIEGQIGTALRVLGVLPAAPEMTRQITEEVFEDRRHSGDGRAEPIRHSSED